MKFGDELKDLTWVSPDVVIYQGIKARLTPMIEQYLDAKAQYPSDVLLFRMGDFYESFFDDAKILNRVLDLTLTSRNKGEDGENIPMAGIPHRTINEYLETLVDAGLRVSICDQLEDPAKAAGIVVKRGITRIVTPGTFTDNRPGSEKVARFLCALAWNPIPKASTLAAIACIDLATGYCSMTELGSMASLIAEIRRTNIKEIVTHSNEMPDFSKISDLTEIAPQFISDEAFTIDGFFQLFAAKTDDDHVYTLGRDKIKGFFKQIDTVAFQNPKLVQNALAGLFSYITELHYPISSNINEIYPHKIDEFMQIDASTFQNLEIYETMRGGQKKGALLSEIDETLTPPGARLLRNWLAYPLKNPVAIQERLDSVEEFYNAFDTRDKIRSLLTDTRDLERLATKVATNKATPKDLFTLKLTLQRIPAFREAIRNAKAPLIQGIHNSLNPLDKLTEKLEAALMDNPPTAIGESPAFKEGYDAKLDKYRSLTHDGKQWLLNFELEQKKLTGINSLKVKYQRVFGYFIEITKSNLSLVPDNYIRKQTLTNSERFYTPELKEYEEELLTAEENKVSREVQLFDELCNFVSAFIPAITENAKQIALLDLLCSFAHTAHQRKYTRPEVSDGTAICLTAARHPVVERCLPKGERFVPNDIEIDSEHNRLTIITGPNMAGKSTIIRQTAVIVLMAQIGSFVPAEKAKIGVVDRIFSRVGASDNLALGQSTFMVEMTETANIIKNATDKSLVILDEIGRGTSTYDGLSLAWAIAEYLHSVTKCRTLFATHYHELTELEYSLPGVKNCSVAVKEYKQEIIFLRKLIHSPANRSYGIQVARLAGIPESVISRAEDLLKMLETNAHNELSHEVSHEVARNAEKHKTQQLALFNMEPDTPSQKNCDELLEEIRCLTLDTMTPIQALNLLYKWQKKWRS